MKQACRIKNDQAVTSHSTVTDLEVADVLEDEGVVDVDCLPDLVVHGVDVGLVDGHALPGQRRGVVDGNVVELWVVLPVLVWFKHTHTEYSYIVYTQVQRRV